MAQVKRNKVPAVARDMRKFKDFSAYEREPMKIHHSTWIVIQLLRGENKLSDLWLDEHFQREHSYLYRRASKQFMLQLEGHACPAFLMALRDQLNLELADWRRAKRRHIRKTKGAK